MKTNIRNYTIETLEKEIVDMGQPAHRARQIFRWLYLKDINDFKEMTNIPQSFIKDLDERFSIETLNCVEKVKSEDGSEKFLWELSDGAFIESVLIKGGGRRTLCLSTQVGCRFGCPFCASGSKGFTRDLSAAEIVNQVLSAQEKASCEITNIVFMGMGEPLDNYDNLMNSIRIINNQEGIGIGARKITVSTCGIIPGILKMKSLGLQVELSISLHAVVNDLRDELVPANRKYPLERLVSACCDYFEYTGRVITLEYVVIPGKNDSFDEADGLARIAKTTKAKINLIPCNATIDKPRMKSAMKRLMPFAERIRTRNVNVTIRKSKGNDINAACGQLAATLAQGSE